MHLRMTCFRILHEEDVKEIGRQLGAEVLHAALKKGHHLGELS